MYNATSLQKRSKLVSCSDEMRHHTQNSKKGSEPLILCPHDPDMACLVKVQLICGLTGSSTKTHTIVMMPWTVFSVNIHLYFKV